MTIDVGMRPHGDLPDEETIDILPACRAQYPRTRFSDLTDEQVGRAIIIAADQRGIQLDRDPEALGAEIRKGMNRAHIETGLWLVDPLPTEG